MKTAKHIIYIFPFLVVAFTNYVNAQVNNPFSLVTDAKLNSSLAAIEKYWSNGTEGNFTGVEGIEIKYKIFKKPNEIGAIVISSGRTESYIKYKELIYNLGMVGYTVYIHDHRGQGFSGRMAEDTQKGHVWNFDNYVADLKTFYDTKVAKDHKNVFLLAHSMGGAIATLYIEKHQNDFKAAALSSPMHQPDTGIPNEVACAGADFTTWIRDIVDIIFDLEPRYAVMQGPYKKKTFVKDNPNIMTHSQQRFEAIQILYDKNDKVKIGGTTSHWLANACEASEELLENATSVTIPVLVLQAEKDIAVTSIGQNTFCDNLKSVGNACEGGEPYLIPGAYHEMFIESDEFRIPAVTKILCFFKQQSIQEINKAKTPSEIELEKECDRYNAPLPLES